MFFSVGFKVVMMDLKSEKSIKEYLGTLSDDEIMKHYVDVEFSPFPILVIQEHARRFNNKTKNEMIKDIKHQSDLAQKKVKNSQSLPKNQTLEETKIERSGEFILQAKKKGYDISDSLLKKSGILVSKLRKGTKTSLRKGIDASKTITSSSEKNLALLEKLAELKKSGILTEREFQEKKKQILDKI